MENIQSVQDDGNGGFIVTMKDGKIWGVPNDSGNRHYQQVQEWLVVPGNDLDPPDPAPIPPTGDEIIDTIAASNHPRDRAWKALAEATADGLGILPATFVTQIKAKM